MTRALVGNDQKVLFDTYAADDETLTDAAAVPAVSVSREDGTILTTAASSTDEAGVGHYSYTLTAATHLTRVDELKLDWAYTLASATRAETTYVKVVRARFFKLAELRALKGLSSVTTYPNATLALMRDVAEDFVEEFCKEAFVPQYRRDVFDGDNCQTLYLPRVHVRSLISVKLAGVTMDTTGWTVSRSGRIRTTGAVFTAGVPAGQNVAVQYELGRSGPPHDLKNATLRLARHITLNLETSIPDRARMMQTEFAMFQLDVASEDKPTGVPEIDAVLIRYREAQPDFIVA